MTYSSNWYTNTTGESKTVCHNVVGYQLSDVKNEAVTRDVNNTMSIQSLSSGS